MCTTERSTYNIYYYSNNTDVHLIDNIIIIQKGCLGVFVFVYVYRSLMLRICLFFLWKMSQLVAYIIASLLTNKETNKNMANDTKGKLEFFNRSITRSACLHFFNYYRAMNKARF